MSMIGAVLIMLGCVLAIGGGSRARLHPTRIDPAAAFARVRRRRQDPAAIVEVLMHLRDELSAGAALRPAMLAALGAGRDPGLLRTVRAACVLGGDVPAALREDGAQHPPLRSLAALWQVSEGSGAALAEGLDRLLESARRAAAVRREVDAQLAGPRSTVRVLAVLPLIGVGLGLAMGADPVGFLLGTVWGWACLGCAAVLEGLGVLWMRALVRSVEDQL